MDRDIWYINTIYYYAAFKKKEILPFAIAWMDQDIMLRKICRLQKDSTTRFHVHEAPKRLIEAGKTIVPARGCRWGKWNVVQWGHHFSYDQRVSSSDLPDDVAPIDNNVVLPIWNLLRG